MKLVNVEEMRQIEQATDARGHSYAAMMAMAGQMVAEIGHGLMIPDPAQHVLILVGPGNNGGDGVVAAQRFLELEHPVTLYVWKRDTKGDEIFRRLKRRRRGITILWADNDPDWAKLREEVKQTDLVIDALLGTGAARPIEGKLAELLAVVRAEVNARRLAETAEEPAPLGIPRFPLMEALALGSPVAPPTVRAPTRRWRTISTICHPSMTTMKWTRTWTKKKMWRNWTGTRTMRMRMMRGRRHHRGRNRPSWPWTAPAA